MDDEKVCWCFNYTVRDIRDDVLAHGKSTILEQIVAEKKNGSCRCATQNPKGR